MRLSPTEAKKLVRRILGEDASVVFTKHAQDEMAKDRLLLTDVENILRGGICREPESENGDWRYQLTTPKIVVVITFRPEPG